MMSLAAVLFDMDGTLVDSMPYHYASWKIFFEEQGIQITDEAFERIHHGTLFDIMPRIFGPISVEECYRLGMLKEAAFRKLYAPEIKPLAGLLPWLNTLQQAGLKIGLGTAADNSNTDFILDAIGIRDYFDAVVTSNVVPEGKPSPAVYLKVAKQLQVPPHQCLVFEDTSSGIQAAVAAGMQVVGVTTGITDAEMRQLPVVDTIADYQQLTLSSFLHLF